MILHEVSFSCNQSLDAIFFVIFRFSIIFQKKKKKKIFVVQLELRFSPIFGFLNHLGNKFLDSLKFAI